MDCSYSSPHNHAHQILSKIILPGRLYKKRKFISSLIFFVSRETALIPAVRPID